MTQTPADRTGEVLDGRYRLESLVGRGGMAEVYRASDQVLGRTVAVKLMHEHALSEDNVRRHDVEARIGAGVNHPGLVTVFDVHASESMPYIVMEYVEGQTLADVLKRGPLAPEVVADIGAQLAAALAVVHDSAVVHRDIKPSNVMLVVGPDHSLTVKLTDFGVSRFVEETRLTSPDLLVGTARYLSPEQAGGEDVHAPSDVYALGLVLLECLTGEDAFPGTRVESMSARLNRPPVVAEHLGPDWARVLGAMTARTPSVRPGARSVAAAMRALAAGDDVKAALGPLASSYGAATAAAATAAAATAPDATALMGATPDPAGSTAGLVPYRAPDGEADGGGGAPPLAVADPPAASSNRALLAAVALLVLVIIAGTAWALSQGRGNDPSDGRTPTPAPSGSVSSSDPTGEPTATPSPTTEPTDEPTTEDTTEPTDEPTTEDTTDPTTAPTTEATTAPTTAPTDQPTTTEKTKKPKGKPSDKPKAGSSGAQR